MPFFRPVDRRAQRFMGSSAVGMIVNRHQIAIAIRIGEGLAKSYGWSIGSRVNILWGQDQDFGTICLEPSTAGVRFSTRSKYGRSLHTTARSIVMHPIRDGDGATWRLLVEPRRMVDVPHVRLEGGLLGLALPGEWFECVRPARRAEAFRAA